MPAGSCALHPAAPDRSRRETERHPCPRRSHRVQVSRSRCPDAMLPTRRVCHGRTRAQWPIIEGADCRLQRLDWTGLDSAAHQKNGRGGGCDVVVLQGMRQRDGKSVTFVEWEGARGVRAVDRRPATRVGVQDARAVEQAVGARCCGKPQRRAQNPDPDLGGPEHSD
ncbi:hypothetical protein BKA80DRAFT_108246 [Phyllosticta citrichinensis]